MQPPKNPIKAVQVTLDLLEAIKTLNGAGVTALADEVGVTKGTAHNHLSTLEYNDYVYKQNGEYRLGFRFFDLAHHARRRVGVFGLVREEIDNLAETSGEMALFTVEEHGLGICLYRALGEESVHTPLYVGHRSPLHHTAVGKAILAHLSRERVEEIIESRGLPKMTEETITNRETLLEELDEIRERGFAVNRQEAIPGLVGVGVPVSHDHDIVGAISIIGPASRMNEDRLYGELPDEITRSVNIIQVNATSI